MSLKIKLSSVLIMTFEDNRKRISKNFNGLAEVCVL